MLENLKTLAVVAGAVIALATLLRTLREYVLQGTQKRAESFFSLRERLDKNEELSTLLRLAQDDDPALADPHRAPYQQKFELLGYFEEVGLMMNSGLIRPAVAWYMFGYYVQCVSRSEQFWSNVYRDDLYWTAFNSFASKMAQVEQREARKAESRFRRPVSATSQLRF